MAAEVEPGQSLRRAVVREHGAADDVGLPVHARDPHAVVARAADDASRMRAVALHSVCVVRNFSSSGRSGSGRSQKVTGTALVRMRA